MVKPLQQEHVNYSLYAVWQPQFLTLHAQPIGNSQFPHYLPLLVTCCILLHAAAYGKNPFSILGCFRATNNLPRGYECVSGPIPCI